MNQKLIDLKEEFEKIEENDILIRSELDKTKKRSAWFQLKFFFSYIPILILMIYGTQSNQLIVILSIIVLISTHIYHIHSLKNIANTPHSSLILTNRIIYSFIHIVLMFGLLIYSSDIFIGTEIVNEQLKDILYNRKFDSIFDSIYFSIVTVTTLGYGDIHPIHWYSKLLTILEISIGVWFLITILPILVTLKNEGTKSLIDMEIGIEEIKNNIEEIEKTTIDE